MIGGWYIPPVICDDLITLFKDNKDKQTAGVVGPPLRVDPDEKISTEVPIHPSYDHPTFVIYKKLLLQKLPSILNYILLNKMFPSLKQV